MPFALPLSPSPNGAEALALWQAFFQALDCGELFPGLTDAHGRALRRALYRGLEQLLVWDRPLLEATHGLLWPVVELAARAAAIKAVAASADSPEQRRQARLFLTLLPFPGQWRRLAEAAQQRPSEPEVIERLTEEAKKTAAKIRTRADKPVRLRNLCQVVKPYLGPREKGVLRIFSLPYLFAQDPLPRILSFRYLFLVEPAMGVLFRHAWGRAFGSLADPSVYGAPGADDRRFLSGQHHILSIPMAHGDFIDDLEPPARSQEAQFDLVFNATFDDPARKRHRLMLELLLQPELRQTRILFLGRGRDSAVAAFHEQVRALDLERRVTVAANVPRRSVPEYLARAKIGVHLSLNENGCRCIPEFLRSDLPCVVSSAMAGLDFAMINQDTGCAAPDSQLASAIAATLANRDRYRPRRWFLAHSGSARSSARVNRFFRGLFADLGYDWSEDLVPMTGSGASRYARDSDYQRFLPDFRWILAAFERLRPLPIRLLLE